MKKINALIEWDYCGSHYSVYVKHFNDEEGRRGMTMIFEDVTREKITEMVIPPRTLAAFLKAVNGGSEPYRGII